MKKLYFLILSILISSLGLTAQTTVQYPQRSANYSAFFGDNGGYWDEGADQLGMWANGGGAKQSVAWRTFTEDGTTAGTPSTMLVGDSFTITLSATRAYGVIGLALLSSPTSTSSWADRINNYAVQVNLNGSGGTWDPWQVVSSGGTVNASSISGSTSYADFKIEFTLNTANTMTVSINDGAESFNVTLNNTDITGYSIYFADDWNGDVNANIYWKPVTEYTYAISLGTDETNLRSSFKLYPNPTNTSFKISKSINELKIFDVSGKMVKSYSGTTYLNKDFDISELNDGIYLVKMETDNGQYFTSKLIKY